MVEVVIGGSDRQSRFARIAGRLAGRYGLGHLGLLAVLWIVVLGLVLPPFIYLVSTSLSTAEQPGTGHWSVANYFGLLTDASLLPLLRNTCVFSAGSSALSVVVGSLLAFMVVRTDMPFKTIVIATNTFLLAFPGMIYTVGWILLLSDRGVLTSWLTQLIGSSDPVFTIYSLPGMIIVEGLCWVPLTFFLMVALFGSLDMALEESAYTSGAGVGTTLRRITLPLIFPGVASLLLLNFMRGLEAFEVPALVGLPGHFEVLASEVFLLTKSSPPQYGTAAAFSVLLVSAMSAFLFAQRRMMLNVPERFQTVRGKGYRSGTYRLGKWRWPAALFVQFILFATFGLPLLSLIWASLLPYYQNPSIGALTAISLENYRSVLQGSSLLGSALNSFVVALVSAVLTMSITCVVAWATTRHETKFASLLDALATAPLVIPGVVMGLAVLELSLQVPLPLFGTLWVIVLAYVASFLPYGMRYATPSVMQIHSELEESAVVSGASEWRALITIVLPLMRPALFGGALFIFMAAFRELPRALLLQGLHTKLISVTLFDLWSDGQLGELGAFGLLFSIPMGLAGLWARRAFGQAGLLTNG